MKETKSTIIHYLSPWLWSIKNKAPPFILTIIIAKNQKKQGEAHDLLLAYQGWGHRVL